MLQLVLEIFLVIFKWNGIKYGNIIVNISDLAPIKSLISIFKNLAMIIYKRKFWRIMRHINL